MKALVVLCVMALVYTTSAMHFQSTPTIRGQTCNATLTAFTVTEFDVEPWYPVKSGNFTVILAGTFNEAVTLTGSKAAIYYGTSLLTTVNVPASGTFAAGDTYNNTFSEPVPAFLPPGQYAVKTYLLEDETPLGCWEIDFPLI